MILLQGVVGSTAYGLNTPDSDVDRLATYLAPTRDLLGFGLSKSQQTIVTRDPDQTTHEIGKYASLAMQVNPTITELMWLPVHDIKHPLGQELIDLRYHFLSEKRVKDAYCGYAIQQAKRLLRRNSDGWEGFGDVPKNRTNKHGRHCFRLLLQAEQILRQEYLTVRLDKRQAEQCFEMGDWADRDPQGFHDAMVARAHALDGLETKLFDKPDTERIEEWLISVRARQPYLAEIGN